MSISKHLDVNIDAITKDFKDAGDLIHRKFPVGDDKKVWMYVAYIDLLVDREFIETQVIRNIILTIPYFYPNGRGMYDPFEALKERAMTTADLKETDKYDEVTSAMLDGDAVLLVDGSTRAIILNAKGFPNRGVSTAETEAVVQGSREAFTEPFRFNTMLVRRRLRDINLKLLQFRIGRRTDVAVGIMYLDDIVRRPVLDDVVNRIKSLDVDAVLDLGHLEQLIEEDWVSPFPQAQLTERPDKAASAILEGRIAILLDNSPFALLVPSTFNVFFQASEDYYQRWEIATFLRLLRYVAGFIAFTLPAIYLVVAIYHPSMLPADLVLKMAAARQNIPFPAVIEILFMDFAIELLREAGLRLPGPLGGAIGVVGGLIVGEAAMIAGILSPVVIIIVAMTAICGFAIPAVWFTSAYRIMKYLLIILSATLGLFGFWIGLLMTAIHLASLKSFGIPYMFPWSSGGINGLADWQDTIFRLPFFTMKKRPIFADPNKPCRLKKE